MTSVIAHRGASSTHPENTLAAFAAAREQGADWVELDARRTADGAVVVHHDPVLSDGRIIVELPAAELPADVPSLADALDACAGMGVNIEIKNLPDDPDHDPTNRIVDDVLSLLAERGEREAALITCFDLAVIDHVRAVAPEVATGWLVLDARDVAATVQRCVRHGHGALNPFVAFVDGELIDAAHAAGLVVNTWTIDDPMRIAELVALGIDGVITNDPAAARRVVDASG